MLSMMYGQSKCKKQKQTYKQIKNAWDLKFWPPEHKNDGTVTQSCDINTQTHTFVYTFLEI